MDNNSDKICRILFEMGLMTEESISELVREEEKEVALKILSTLSESNVSVIRATNILNFCLEAIKFSKVEI